MPQNPLLPNAKLRQLHSLTQRCTELEARRIAERPRSPQSSREALLAGTVVQLQPGDLLLGEPGDSAVAALALPEKPGAPLNRLDLPSFGKASAALFSAASVAAHLQATAGQGLALVHLQAGSRQLLWREALTWAQERQLPLIVVCADARGASTFLPEASPEPSLLTWDQVQSHAARLKLPILTTDGADAVAVYRAMQESILRARAGGGPAILWAMLPSARELKARRPPLTPPLARLEQYLRTRRISFRAGQRSE